jgi:hypothetical protein
MFGPTGIVRVDNAFPVDVADIITGMIWAVLSHHFGIERERSETWKRTFRKRALDQISTAPIFDEILTDRLAAVVDQILGVGSWDWPTSWGDFLITFPHTRTWTLPTRYWHQDWSFDVDCDPPRWVKAFIFLNEVKPSGGGTLVVTGSHLLPQRFSRGRILGDAGRPLKDFERLYVECRYLRELAQPGDDQTRRRRFMDAETNIDNVPLQVVELTGSPGDVVFIHPWLVHAVAPNAADALRLMRAPVFGHT